MEWKTPPVIKHGQTRERLKFAWLPAECADGKTRWLCAVRVVEEFVFIPDVVHGWVRRATYRAEVEIDRRSQEN